MSSVAHVSSGYARSLRPCIASTHQAPAAKRHSEGSSQSTKTASGIAIETLRIEVRGELDLAGFLGARDDAPVALTAIHYVLHVQSDADDEVLESLREAAERHSPNAMTLRAGVALVGHVLRG